jgi:hypothetical protein
MHEDPLKEQLTSYARAGAEKAFQPGATEIYRRARRHYQRVAALSATGMLLATGIGVGLGLHGRGAPPTVNQPKPPPTSPAPAVTSMTATTRAPATTPSTTRADASGTGKVPGTFVAGHGGRVAVISTATGRIVRTLWAPPPGGTVDERYAVGLSPDRATVYFSLDGDLVANACDQAGIFRVPFDGGQATKVVADENAVGPITTSADGSKLAYKVSPCPSTPGRIDIVLRDVTGALLHRWSGMPPLDPESVETRAVSLSPDGRRLAVTLFRNLSPVGVRVLDAEVGTSVTDGRLIQAPDRGCGLVNAAFEPRTGRLAAFERCLPKGGSPPRFKLLYLDPVSGRLLSRSFAFDDPFRGDLGLPTMDFDQTGRHLLYAVRSADPADSEPQPRRPGVGTWRQDGGPPVRLDDDQCCRGGERILSDAPSW